MLWAGGPSSRYNCYADGGGCDGHSARRGISAHRTVYLLMNRISVLRALVVVSALFTSTMLGAPAHGQAVRSPTPRSNPYYEGLAAAAQLGVEPDAWYLMAEYGLPQAEAEDRLRNQEAISTLNVNLGVHFPSGLAGMWLNHAAGGIVHISATQDALDPIREYVAAQFEGDSTFEFHVAERSLQQLYSDAARLATLWRILPVSLNATGWAVNEPLNVIDVHVPASSVILAQQWFDRSFGRGLVRAIAGDRRGYLDGPGDCNPLRCDPPLRGGVGIRYSDRGNEEAPVNESGNNCSGGFTAINEQGARYYLTAGHCGAGGDANPADAMGHIWWVQKFTTDTWLRIGGVPNNGAVVAGTVDAARILVEDGGEYGVGFSRWVRAEPGVTQLQIRHVNETSYGATPGLVLCRSDRHEVFPLCGGIIDRMSGATIAGGTTGHFTVDICGRGGDSGAGFYSRRDQNDPSNSYMVFQGTAFGLNIASSNEADDFCPQTEWSYGSHMGFVQHALDVHVWCGGADGGGTPPHGCFAVGAGQEGRELLDLVWLLMTPVTESSSDTYP